MMDNKNNPSSVPWSFMINFSVILPQSSFSVIVMCIQISFACLVYPQDAFVLLVTGFMMQ